MQLEEGFFTGGWLCRPRAACGTRVLFSVLVASGSAAGCSGEVRARGHVVPSVGRGGCCGSAKPLSLGLPSRCRSRGGGGSFHQRGYRSSARADGGA